MPPPEAWRRLEGQRNGIEVLAAALPAGRDPAGGATGRGGRNLRRTGSGRHRHRRSADELARTDREHPPPRAEIRRQHADRCRHGDDERTSGRSRRLRRPPDRHAQLRPPRIPGIGGAGTNHSCANGSRDVQPLPAGAGPGQFRSVRLAPGRFCQWYLWSARHRPTFLFWLQTERCGVRALLFRMPKSARCADANSNGCGRGSSRSLP